jgi:hypothetical protein
MSHADIFKYVKPQRIRWIGHIVRMDKERTVKRVRRWRRNAVRWTGRLRLRWEGDVGDGLGRMRIHNWIKMAMDREAWKRVAEEAKTYRVVLPREQEDVILQLSCVHGYLVRNYFRL